MSDFGVEPDDMTRSVLIDDKLDALLAGREAAPGDDLAVELSFMLGQLHQAFPSVVVSEQVEDVHIAQIKEATASLPVAEPAGTVSLQTPLLDRIRAGLSRRVAAATLALTTAFGGAAYAGVLPTPIQRGVAELAAVVGLDLPDGDHGTDMRRPLPDGDEGVDGMQETERGQDPASFGGTVEERPRNGDAARGGADSEDRDQHDDSDLDSDDGEEDRETDKETDDDHETDGDLEDDGEPENDGGDNSDNGQPEESESEDSEDSAEELRDEADELRDEAETEESSDSGLDPEEP